MNLSDAEYESLRNELIHHDESCITILSLLLAATTTIYGLITQFPKQYPILMILSLIWLVGFLYIVEKRSSIRRISIYIQKKFEVDGSSFSWETYSRKSRYGINSDVKGANVALFPTISPLKIEYALLCLITLVNTLWLWTLADERLVLGSIVFCWFSLFWSGYILWKYYTASREASEDQSKKLKIEASINLNTK